MDADWFWKNFRLGTELQVSGTFIYNSLEAFDRCELIQFEEDCFEFLYNMAVGLERLSKICVALCEISSDHDFLDQVDLEESLITHSTNSLIDRIKKQHKIDLDKSHHALISMLDSFYKRTRYVRYTQSSVYSKNADLEGLINFLNLFYGDCIDAEFKTSPLVTGILKRRLGKTVIKITSQIYEAIRVECTRHNTFTYEIRYGSKAFKIFMAKEGDFATERIIQRECLLHVQRHGFRGILKDIVDGVEPIELDPYTMNAYIRAIFSYDLSEGIEEELEVAYEGIENIKDRFERLSYIGSDTNFEQFEEDEQFIEE